MINIYVLIPKIPCTDFSPANKLPEPTKVAYLSQKNSFSLCRYVYNAVQYAVKKKLKNKLNFKNINYLKKY